MQGVNYRGFAASHARSLGLVGYCRNLPDGGTVEVYAEGPRQAIDDLLRRLREGPGMSRIDKVEAAWAPATGAYDSFEIRW